MDKQQSTEIADLDTRILELQTWITKTQDHDQSGLEETYQRVRTLQKHRNSLVPLCQLPLDILRHILYILVVSTHKVPHAAVPDGLDGYRERNLFGKHTKWMPITAVCSHIRSLALASRSLWTYIDLSRNRRWANLCLERAGSSLLCLAYRGNWSRDRERAPRLFATIRQAWAVRIYFLVHRDDSSTLNEILDGQLPFLRTFLYRSMHGYILSPKFLGGATISLTKLVLHNVTLASEAPDFASLLYLELSHLRAPLGPKQLLGLLEKAPQLNCLHIRVAWFTSPRTPNVDVRPINLPRLTTVYIENYVASIGTLIDILPLPQCGYHVEIVSVIYRADPIEVVNRQRIENCQRAFHKFGLHQNSLPSPVVHLRKWGTDNFELTLAHSDESGKDMTYKDRYVGVPLFNPILDELEMLHLHGSALEGAINYTTTRPDHAFSRLKHLVMEDGEGGLRDLLTWLRSRAALGHRLRVIDFKKCTEYVREAYSITNVKDVLIKEGLAEEVLEDGHVPVGPRFPGDRYP